MEQQEVVALDSADETSVVAATRAAGRQLIADQHGLAANLVPDDPAHMLHAIARLNSLGGL